MQLNFKKWLNEDTGLAAAADAFAKGIAGPLGEKLVQPLATQVGASVAQQAAKSVTAAANQAAQANKAANQTPAALRTPGDVSGITNAQQAKAFNPKGQTAPYQGNVPQQDTQLAAALEKGIVKGFQTVLGK